MSTKKIQLVGNVQEKITGTTGQLVGFDENGKAIAQDTPNAPAVVEQNKGLEQKFWRGTQAEYDALTIKDEGTMYIITDTDGEVTAIGDMLASVYDPQGKAQDIFAYVDAAISDAIGGSY